MQDFLLGVLLVGFGVVYLRNPGIFRRGIWMKTSIAIRFLSEKNYQRYMKGLGIAQIAIGAVLVLFALSSQMGWHY
jgi:hypothetical protein